MPVSASAKRRLAPLAKVVAPRWFWRRKYDILARLGVSRPDIQLVRALCDPERISLDIGADVGEFAIAMATSSRSVVAFEPRSAQAGALATMFAAVGAAILVETVALSDRAGVTAMRVLESAPGRSTIDPGNALEDTEGSRIGVIEVPMRRLDDLQLDDVGFIKIDVEGHELAVLHGAEDTLRRNRPTLLVEAEERHHRDAVAVVTEFLTGLGYAGYFGVDGSWRPIAEFDPGQHQNPAHITGRDDGWTTRGRYVNDFVFVPIGGWTNEVR